MDKLYANEDLLELELIRLKQRIESRDFKEAAKVSARISKVCNRLKPGYDYSCSLGDYDRIMNTLSSVDYNVGKYLPKVTW
jgi:hypothetical protein